MTILGMNHFTVLAENLEATKRFYMDLLGLTEGYRPPLGFPGAWLYCGDQAVLHIIAGRALPPDPRGVLDHMAFTASDLDLRRQNDSGTWQLFCFDPSGARVELDFAPGEPAP